MKRKMGSSIQVTFLERVVSNTTWVNVYSHMHESRLQCRYQSVSHNERDLCQLQWMRFLQVNPVSDEGLQLPLSYLWMTPLICIPAD